MKKVDMIVDLQYGSTGKGLIAGYLAKRGGYDTVINANMPNAGHTFIDDTGREWIHKVLPNGIVADSVKTIMIGPMSVFSEERLLQEIYESKDILEGKRIMIHPNAMVLQQHHAAAERASMSAISSTMQGSAAASVEKMMRGAISDDKCMIIAKDTLRGTELGQYVCTHEEWVQSLCYAKKILAEAAQGYSLGLNTEFYPYVTSRDCVPSRFMADMGIPHNMLNKVIGTARTYPIRVGNTPDGFSGDHYPDQSETSWEELGQKAELTTVTKRERRVFTFSQKQIQDALFWCAPDEIFLNFCNYMSEREVARIVEMIEPYGAPVAYYGYGPREGDIR